MKTTLYITRHGETLWNLEGRMQGWKDSPLSEKGIEQAKLLYERLKCIDFNKIYSSSCGRAFKTAEILKGTRDLKLIKEDDLREVNMGNWEGMLQSDIEKKWPDQIHNFWKAPNLYKSETGEDFCKAQKRLVLKVEKIINDNLGKTVLIVTHAAALKLILCHYANRNIKEMWEPPFIYQTSLSILQIEEEKAEIIMEGDTSHYNNEKIG